MINSNYLVIPPLPQQGSTIGYVEIYLPCISSNQPPNPHTVVKNC